MTGGLLKYYFNSNSIVEWSINCAQSVLIQDLPLYELGWVSPVAYWSSANLAALE